MVDPREEITHEIESGQTYTDSRTGEELFLVYEDGATVLMRDRNTNHRLIRRNQFDKDVGGGRYKLAPDADPFEDVTPSGERKIEFEELDNIGQKGADELRNAGYLTESDVYVASNEELLDVPWIGEAGVDSLREAVQ
jgi:hypothetical protein